MTRLLGANWRTTLTAAGAAIASALTGLAALPYDLGPIATVIPPAWKARITLTGAAAAIILKFWNGALQKDRNVTGGSVPNDVAAGDASVSRVDPKLPLGLLLITLALGLAGCSAASPFTPASAPVTGKIPVKVVAGTHVTGSLADPTAPTYPSGVDVVFGRPAPWYRRVFGLFLYGPLTREDEARWDADLRAEAAATVPHIGVVHYPGEAP